MKDKIIIVDIETNVFEEQKDHFDVIQIGAYKIKGLEVVSQFNEYVMPTKNPILTDFIIDLTGIKQAQVDVAEPFPEVWKKFTEWAKPYNIMLSWGNYDYILFEKVSKHFGLNFPFKHHINLKHVAQFLMNLTKGKRGLGGLTKHLNLPYVGHHDAICDVEMTFNVMKYMIDNKIVHTFKASNNVINGKNVMVNPSIAKLYRDLGKRRERLERHFKTI